MEKSRTNVFMYILWLFAGIAVGFSAIMPGISGGTLCAALGMYLPIVKTLSHPRKYIPQYGKMLFFFGMGGFVGFVGLSGFAAWLISINSTLVTCAFIGFVVGTFPELWSDAGKIDRNKKSYISMILAFAFALSLLVMLKSQFKVSIQADFWGFIFCGILWGLSFIIPGLSSSTLLLFFGLYEPMLDGIAAFDIKIIASLAVGAAGCVLLLSKGITMLYQRQYSVASHAIIGIVAATVIMIIPDWSTLKNDAFYAIVCIVFGAIISYALTKMCMKIKK